MRRARMRSPLASEEGSAPAEFVLVGALLLVLVLGVVQLGLDLLVRNTVLDAASEGARWASLAGNDLADGVGRTRELIDVSIGPAYAQDVTARRSEILGRPAAVVTVRAPLPVVGLLGLGRDLEVSGHAVLEADGW